MTQRWDAGQGQSQGGQRFDEAQRQVARDRARFFELLAMLSGSSIALSLTFLGYVQSRPKTAIQHVGFVHMAWFLLLGCLIAALSRNLKHSDYFYYFHASSYLQERTGAEGVSEEEKQDVGREAQRSADMARRAEVMWRVCEYAAQISFALGLLLLVIFATVNTR